MSERKKNIVPGTQYQFDLDDLAFVGKTPKGIALHYKQGLQVVINIDDPNDRERQYNQICSIHDGTIDWQDIATEQP